MVPWSWAACLAAAVVASGTPTTTKVRVTGLFAPEREHDLRGLLAGWPEVKLVAIDFDRAEAELAIDAKLFPKAKPAEVVARLDERVGQLSRRTFGVRAASAVPRDKLTRVEISVAGLDCKACCLGAYEVVAKVDGVEQATVSFKDGRVTALIDPTKTDRAKLAALLKQRGVEVR